MTTRLQYSCDRCGIKRQILDVPARQDEDITVWMDRTIYLVAHDHRRLSPTCNAKSLTELLIPMTGTDRIGGPVTN